MLSWAFHKHIHFFFIDRLWTIQIRSLRLGKARLLSKVIKLTTRNNKNGKQPLIARSHFFWVGHSYSPSPGYVQCHLSHSSVDLWWYEISENTQIAFLSVFLVPLAHFLQIPITLFVGEFFSYPVYHKRYRIKKCHPWATVVMTMSKHALVVLE